LRSPEESKLFIVYQKLDQLHFNPNNARIHSKRQIRQIKASMSEFGFTNPVLVDSQDHDRCRPRPRRGGEASGDGTGADDSTRSGSSDEQIRAYIIADNKLAENAGWDRSILAIELRVLVDRRKCADYDVTITGFEVAEIDGILEEARGAVIEEDEVPEPILDHTPVTEPGDLSGIWASTGSSAATRCTKTPTVNLLGSRRADAVFH
jgi:hypothetical protein